MSFVYLHFNNEVNLQLQSHTTMSRLLPAMLAVDVRTDFCCFLRDLAKAFFFFSDHSCLSSVEGGTTDMVIALHTEKLERNRNGQLRKHVCFPLAMLGRREINLFYFNKPFITPKIMGPSKVTILVNKEVESLMLSHYILFGAWVGGEYIVLEYFMDCA